MHHRHLVSPCCLFSSFRKVKKTRDGCDSSVSDSANQKYDTLCLYVWGHYPAALCTPEAEQHQFKLPGRGFISNQICWECSQHIFSLPLFSSLSTTVLLVLGGNTRIGMGIDRNFESNYSRPALSVRLQAILKLK